MMRFLKRLVKVSVFVCIMAAGVAGVLFVEQETKWIETFQYAVGLKKDEKPKFGITFAGNKIGQQRLQRRRDDAFIASLKHMFGGGGAAMSEAQKAAIVAQLDQFDSFDFEMDEGAVEKAAPVKKTKRSGSLGGLGK